MASRSEWTALQAVCKVVAFEPLHRQERAAGFVVAVRDVRDDVGCWMVARISASRTKCSGCRGRGVGMEELYSDDLTGLLVERAVDHSHAALANLPCRTKRPASRRASAGRTP